MRNSSRDYSPTKPRGSSRSFSKVEGYMWLKIIFRIVAGVVVGYLAYIPVLLVVEYATFAGRVDMEKAFYALYFPLEGPYLLLPSTWKSVRTDEMVLQLVGGLLLITGVVFSIGCGGPFKQHCTDQTNRSGCMRWMSRSKWLRSSIEAMSVLN